MSLSFAESLIKAQEDKVALAVAQMPLDENAATAHMNDLIDIPATTDETINLVAAYDGWMKPSNSIAYIYYDDQLPALHDPAPVFHHRQDQSPAHRSR